MLALKKKREAEAKAAAAAQASASAVPSSIPSSAGQSTSSTNDNGAATAAPTNKVSLLGIGGKKTSVNEKNGGGKKRTPGEIRIQKGESGEVLCAAFDLGVSALSRTRVYG